MFLLRIIDRNNYGFKYRNAVEPGESPRVEPELLQSFANPRRDAVRKYGDNMDGRDKNAATGRSQVTVMQSAEMVDKKKPSNITKLDRNTRIKLGQHLRAMYDEVVSQGVPQRFSALLDRLSDNSNKDKIGRAHV